MIDWERVRELRHDIGKDNFDEVVALFFIEADRAVARLTASNGAQVLSAQLHALKGAALNLGFDQLAGLCRRYEDLVAGGNIDIDIDAVHRAYDDARRAYEHGAASSFAA